MKVREIRHEHFDEAKLDLWWRFLVERQRIWVRRAHLQIPRPWTTDRAMNYEFITNVYRELDPGTEYVLDSISAGELDVDVVFNVMLYRLMGSSMVVHSVIGNLSVDTYDADALVANVKSQNANPFGDAYRVAGYETHRGEGNGSKLENVANMFAKLAEQMPEMWRRMQTSVNAKSLHGVFNSIEGFGVFLSNQCMVDVLMINEGLDAPIWHFGTDEWCEPGPGAKRGITQLLGDGVKPANLQIVMAWLRDAQTDEFAARSLHFPYLLNRDDTPKLLTICNIQTALCEFHKYVRSRGQIKVRAYTKTPSMLQAFDVDLSDDEIAELTDITACTPPENTYAKTDQNAQISGQTGVFAVDADLMTAETAPELAQLVGELRDRHFVPEPTGSALITPPAASWDVQNGVNLAQIVAAFANQQNRQQAQVIPVDPTGLLRLPKAIIIVPIY